MAGDGAEQPVVVMATTPAPAAAGAAVAANQREGAVPGGAMQERESDSCLGRTPPAHAFLR